MNSTAQQARSERDSATGRLLRAYRSDGDIRARDRLVTLYLPLVETFANRYRRPGAEYDDLVQAGSIGLLNAIERYDPARGDEFAAFAVPTVVGEIKRHIRDRSAAVRLPRPLQEAAARLPREREELTAQLGREPTDDELAAALGVDAVDLARLREPAPAALPDEPDAEDASDDRVTLAGAFEVLDETERAAVYLQYVRDLDKRKVAHKLGISERQLARRTRSALAKLRGEMEQGGGPPVAERAAGSEATQRQATGTGGAEAPATEDSPDPEKARKPNGHSGRLLLRMPQDLHADLAREAERGQLSLNQFIVNSLSAAVEGSKATQPAWLRTALIVNAVLLAIAAVAAIALILIVG